MECDVKMFDIELLKFMKDVRPSEYNTIQLCEHVLNAYKIIKYALRHPETLTELYAILKLRMRSHFVEDAFKIALNVLWARNEIVFLHEDGHIIVVLKKMYVKHYEHFKQYERVELEL